MANLTDAEKNPLYKIVRQNEEPRRKRTGYQDVFYSDTPQAAGNSPLTTIKKEMKP